MRGKASFFGADIQELAGRIEAGTDDAVRRDGGRIEARDLAGAYVAQVKASARVQAAVSWNDASGMLAVVVPFVPSGPTTTNLAISYSTLLGLAAPPSTSATFTMTFTDSEGKNVTKTVSVAASKTVEYKLPPGVLVDQQDQQRRVDYTVKKRTDAQ